MPPPSSNIGPPPSEGLPPLPIFPFQTTTERPITSSPKGTPRLGHARQDSSSSAVVDHPYAKGGTAVLDEIKPFKYGNSPALSTGADSDNVPGQSRNRRRSSRASSTPAPPIAFGGLPALPDIPSNPFGPNKFPTQTSNRTVSQSNQAPVNTADHSSHAARLSQSVVDGKNGRQRAPSLATAVANQFGPTLTNGPSNTYASNGARSPTPQQPQPLASSSPISPEQSTYSRGSMASNGHANTAPSSAGTGRGSSSKSVLTVALQKANSAVLLDQAGNYPGAIAAYQQSVRMLKEVMDRVDESAANWKAREGDRARARMQALTSETEADMQERLKREERTEKREKARLEEARRLRVIHDTYIERCSALTVMLNESDLSLDADDLPESPMSAPDVYRQSFDPSQEQQRFAGQLGKTSDAFVPFEAQDSRPSALTSRNSMSTITPSNAHSDKDSYAREHRGGGSTLSTASFLSTGSSDSGKSPSQVDFPEKADPSAANYIGKNMLSGHLSSGPSSASAGDSTTASEPSPNKFYARTPASTPARSGLNYTLDVDITSSPLVSAASADRMYEASKSVSPELATRTDAAIPSTQESAHQPSASLSGVSPFPSTAPNKPSIRSVSQPVSSFKKDTNQRDSFGPELTSPKRVPVPRNSLDTRQDGTKPLINDVTSLGTISQRRKPADDLTEFDQVERLHDVRPASSASIRPVQDVYPNSDQNGLKSASSDASSFLESNAKQSLPLRARAWSTSSRKAGQSKSLSPVPPPWQEPLSASAQSVKQKMALPAFQSSVIPPQTPDTALLSGFFESSTRATSPALYGLEGSNAETPTSSVFPSLPLASPNAFIALAAASTPAIQKQLFVPVNAQRRPYQLMLRLRASLLSGCHLTPALYAPRSIWQQAGVKLIAVDSKVRAIELLLAGLESIDRIGEAFLPLRGPEDTGLARQTGEMLAKELEVFDHLLDEVQNTLAKKLGFIENAKGKKGGSRALGALLPKISRSIDKMTSGKHLDAPATYFDSLSKLFLQVQSLDRHLVLLSPETANSTPYALCSVGCRTSIESRLRRASDFFTAVVCRFVLRDVGILLDKHAKRSAIYALE